MRATLRGPGLNSGRWLTPYRAAVQFAIRRWARCERFSIGAAAVSTVPPRYREVSRHVEPPLYPALAPQHPDRGRARGLSADDRSARQPPRRQEDIGNRARGDDQAGRIPAPRDPVQRLDLADSRPVDPSPRETPSAGKELGFVEQLLGNLGKFNTGAASRAFRKG